MWGCVRIAEVKIMVSMSSAARIWLGKNAGSLYYQDSFRFIHVIRECCNYPAYVKDDLSALIAAARDKNNWSRLAAFAERFKITDDPRATYELYLMWFRWGLVYPTDDEHVQMAKQAFVDHVSAPLTELQKELLADMVRNSAEDGDYVTQALLPVVDSSFVRYFSPRLDEARESLEEYINRPDWEGDYYDQINVIMYQERIKELESLLARCRNK